MGIALAIIGVFAWLWVIYLIFATPEPFCQPCALGNLSPLVVPHSCRKRFKRGAGILKRYHAERVVELELEHRYEVWKRLAEALAA